MREEKDLKLSQIFRSVFENWLHRKFGESRWPDLNPDTFRKVIINREWKESLNPYSIKTLIYQIELSDAVINSYAHEQQF